MTSRHITIIVQPGAKTSQLTSTAEGGIKIRLQAPAQDGKANRALIAFLSRQLGLKKQEIRIVQGQKSRLKVLALPDTDHVQARLQHYGIKADK